jgi:hypothetical protein
MEQAATPRIAANYLASVSLDAAISEYLVERLKTSAGAVRQRSTEMWKLGLVAGAVHEESK